jgi:hypothetical protein
MGASPPSPGQKDPLWPSQGCCSNAGEYVVSASLCRGLCESVANENQLHHSNQRANEKIPLMFDFLFRKKMKGKVIFKRPMV